QPQRDLRVDAAADGPKRRTEVETTRRRTHQSRLTRGRASPGSASKSGSKITRAFCSCAHDTAPLPSPPGPPMAETKRMTADEVVGYLLEGEGLDFLRESLTWICQQMMEAECPSWSA